MAAKLVVRREVRTSKDVAWYKAPDATKASVKAAGGIRAAAGHNVFNNGVKKFSTLFFPRVDLYDAYVARTDIAEAKAARSAYNAANGITENEVVISLPNFSM
jgi:hypothetical protein